MPLSFRPLKSNDSKKTILWFIGWMLIYFGTSNLVNFEHKKFPCFIAENVECRELKLFYCYCSLILSLIFIFGLILLFETMFDRIGRHLDNVISLSHLIIKNPYSEYASFSRIDNILSWLALERLIKRKGIMLFASLETPLICLGIMIVGSWSAIAYCLTNGIGLGLFTHESLISNSALATWFVFGLFPLIQALRLLIFYGRIFSNEAIKQDSALKLQCGTNQENSLMKFLSFDKLTSEEERVLKAAPMLLQHIVHDEIVPEVFGIKFDNLTTTAVIGAVIGQIPAIYGFLTAINWHG